MARINESLNFRTGLDVPTLMLAEVTAAGAEGPLECEDALCEIAAWMCRRDMSNTRRISIGKKD